MNRHRCRRQPRPRRPTKKWPRQPSKRRLPARSQPRPASRRRLPAKPAPAGEQASPSDTLVAGFNYARLRTPDVAGALELTDQQCAAVAELINGQAGELAKSPPDQREAVIAATDKKLAAVLNDQQRAKLSELAAVQKLRFNFRYQKWEDVLDWFARQAGLALVMDQPPSGAFTYSDNKSYTPAEAIDLLNRVLITKGYTLVHRGRMLTLFELNDTLSLDVIRRVKPAEIAGRGEFEMISTLFPLGRRPADTVLAEITPLLGPYGKCVALPHSKQLLVIETAGKMQAIGVMIAFIPEPPLPEPPAKPVPTPAPVLGIYTVPTMDPKAAVETLTLLFPKAEFDDRRQGQPDIRQRDPVRSGVHQGRGRTDGDQPPAGAGRGAGSVSVRIRERRGAAGAAEAPGARRAGSGQRGVQAAVGVRQSRGPGEGKDVPG